MKYNKTETNPSVEWKARRKKILSCSYCPPNKGENRGRSNKFYSRSWKDKTRRKRQFKPTSDCVIDKLVKSLAH